MAKEDPEVRQLREIKQELKAIKGNTEAANSFLHGLLYGAGWIVGSLLAIVLIGWILSIMGVIPGFDKIAQILQAAFSQMRR